MNLSYFETVNDDSSISYDRPEAKVKEALKRAIDLSSEQSVIDRFASLYLAGIQWDWFESYQQHLVNVDEINELNNNRSIVGSDEFGVDILEELIALPEAPERPDELTVSELMAQLL